MAGGAVAEQLEKTPQAVLDEAVAKLDYINSFEDFLNRPPDFVLAGFKRLWDIAYVPQGGRKSLLSWPLAQRIFGHLMRGRQIKDAAALSFASTYSVNSWLMMGKNQLEDTEKDEEKYPLTIYGVFYLCVEHWLARRRAEREDNIYADADADPRYRVWEITLLERINSEHYGRKSVVKSEVKQEIEITFKEADGSRWVSGNAAPVRQVEDAIPTRFLPAAPSRRNQESDEEDL